MKKNRAIHDLDSLEKEIFRLRLEAKNMEDKMEGEFNRLVKSGAVMIRNSIFCNVTENAGKGLDYILDKLFNRKKKQSSE